MNDHTAARTSNLETVQRFFDPTQRNLRPTLFADDMTMYLPFSGRILPRIEWNGLSELHDMESVVQTMFVGLTYHDVEIFEGADPNDFWVLARFGEDTLLCGRPYPQHFIHHFTVVDGKIRRWDEYFDSFYYTEVIEGRAIAEFPETTSLRRTGSAAPVDAQATELRAQNEAVIKKFLEADPYAAGARAALWSPDAIKELAWVPSGFPKRRWTGTEELEENSRAGRSLFEFCIHTDIEVYPTVDPAIFWVTSHMDPRSKMGGKLYPQRFVLGFRVEDGKIAIFQEFFDTALLNDVFRAALDSLPR